MPFPSAYWYCKSCKHYKGCSFENKILDTNEARKAKIDARCKEYEPIYRGFSLRIESISHIPHHIAEIIDVFNSIQ